MKGRSRDGISSVLESALETTFWPQGPPVSRTLNGNATRDQEVLPSCGRD